MRARNGWLFPLMVLAAGSVMVFGCIGIAAITGYLPLAKVSATPFGEPVIAHSGVAAPLGVPSIQPDHSVALASPPIQAEDAAAGAGQLKPLPAAKKPSP
jgi:hypothetical protein